MIKRLRRIKYGIDFDESLSSGELSALDGLRCAKQSCANAGPPFFFWLNPTQWRSSLDDDEVRELLAEHGTVPSSDGTHTAAICIAVRCVHTCNRSLTAFFLASALCRLALCFSCFFLFFALFLRIFDLRLRRCDGRSWLDPTCHRQITTQNADELNEQQVGESKVCRIFCLCAPV